MIRVCDFEFDGQQFKISSLSVKDAEDFATEGAKMKGATDPVAIGEWLGRRDDLVVLSITNALRATTRNEEARSWTRDFLRQNFDIPTVEALYARILDYSGLAPKGEAKAPGISPSSGAV